MFYYNLKYYKEESTKILTIILKELNIYKAIKVIKDIV
jgi:hypothetical protein